MEIHVLDKSVADKIAAGEVIERPVSIIKELVENSIDADSTSIIVEIKNGGKSYIRVTDNGVGIEKSQIEKAFLRHATSKIKSAEDLDSLITLGFRGEALASISAVTRMELITKTATEKTGTRVIIHGGDIINKSPIGCPDGTTMVMKDLFYNTPARLKFMKSDGAETAQVSAFMSNIAIGFPHISFRYVVNGKIVFSTTGSGSLEKAINQVYNHPEYKELLPISAEMDGFSIKGYISKPSISRNSRKSQVYLVNGRMISSKAMDKAVDLGYRERLFEGRFPICFILIQVDPSTIDVNIHPNKKIIRFDDEETIIKLVSDEIHDALTHKHSLPTPATEADLSHTSEFKENLVKDEDQNYDAETTSLASQGDNNPIQEFTSPLQLEDTKQLSLSSILRREHEEEAIKARHNDTQEFQEEQGEGFKFKNERILPWENIRAIGMVFSTYILATDEKIFYIIDQHAAHERIFYEELVGKYKKTKENMSTTQMLAPGVIINLTPEEHALMEAWKKVLDNLGFEVEIFGPDSIIIRGIPDFMSIDEGEVFAKNVIENTDSKLSWDNTVAIDKLITKSCKSAIKAGDVMTTEEIQGLIDTLRRCENPYSCPHGRPTIIKFNKYDLEKLFKRA